MSLNENDLYFKALLHKIYKYKYMSETTEYCKCRCNSCECVEDDKHIFKIMCWWIEFMCKIVGILTEEQYIEMYERISKKILKHKISIWKK